MSNWNLKGMQVGTGVTITFSGENWCVDCNKSNQLPPTKMAFFGIIEQDGDLYYSFVPSEPMLCEHCGKETFVYLEVCDEEVEK